MEYNADLELDERADDLTEVRVDELLDQLTDYAAVISRSAFGRTVLTITVPAETLRQAATTSLAVVEAAGGRPVAIEVMATSEYDRRAGLQPMPELVSVTEAAELLGVSRQAVLQRLERGTLPGRKVGDTWAIARTALSR